MRRVLALLLLMSSAALAGPTCDAPTEIGASQTLNIEYTTEMSAFWVRFTAPACGIYVTNFSFTTPPPDSLDGELYSSCAGTELPVAYDNQTNQDYFGLPAGGSMYFLVAGSVAETFRASMSIEPASQPNTFGVRIGSDVFAPDNGISPQAMELSYLVYNHRPTPLSGTMYLLMDVAGIFYYVTPNTSQTNLNFNVNPIGAPVFEDDGCGHSVNMDGLFLPLNLIGQEFPVDWYAAVLDQNSLAFSEVVTSRSLLR